CHQGYSYPWTF
nr:immunoglobulin light chain junction region [Macaca mulatta]